MSDSSKRPFRFSAGFVVLLATAWSGSGIEAQSVAKPPSKEVAEKLLEIFVAEDPKEYRAALKDREKGQQLSAAWLKFGLAAGQTDRGFALVDNARLLAARSAAMDTARSAVERLVSGWGQDEGILGIETIELLQRRVRDAGSHAQLAEWAAELFPKIAVRGDAKATRRADKVMRSSALKSKVERLKALSGRFGAFVKAERRLRRSAKAAETILSDESSDATARAEAHERLGWHRIGVHGEWQAGMDLLSRSHDDEVVAVARAELGARKEAAQAEMLAMDWAGVAEKRDGLEGAIATARALHWARRVVRRAEKPETIGQFAIIVHAMRKRLCKGPLLPVASQAVSSHWIQQNTLASGNSRTQSVLKRSCDWLLRHQSPNGSWDCDGFPTNGRPGLGALCDGAGSAAHDVGVTGLAVLALMSTGSGPDSGRYAAAIRRACNWLLSVQGDQGVFGPRASARFSYDHAIATRALLQALALSGEVRWREPAKRGLDQILAMQNPYKAWDYRHQPQSNDVSTTTWMVQAVALASELGFTAGWEGSSLSWALTFIEELTDEETGRTGYMKRGEPPARYEGQTEAFPAEYSEAMTAAGLLVRALCGRTRAEDGMIDLGIELIARKPARWEPTAGHGDMIYWLRGAEAAAHLDAPQLDKWVANLVNQLIDVQRKDGNFNGSWDPIGVWGETGGRIYATAVGTLTLAAATPRL